MPSSVEEGAASTATWKAKPCAIGRQTARDAPEANASRERFLNSREGKYTLKGEME
jgi:hypothetical protein